jgi:DNA-binding transcriptional MerR regulator
MNSLPLSTFFPIRMLAERTGVGASTLRAWERRYGLLTPQRTPKGHRLYTRSDVDLVLRVQELLADGHSISQAAQRVKADPTAAAVPDAVAASADAPSALGRPSGQWGDYLARLLRAVEAFSGQRLDAVYNEAASLYPLDLVSERLIEPALVGLGQRWQQSVIGIAEEHFFSAWLRNKLGARIHHASSNSSGGAAGGAVLLLACVPGHRHELGLLLFALAALGRGYRVVYLGIDMPFTPLPDVVARCGAKALVLAAGYDAEPEATLPGLPGLRELVTAVGCPVFVGGPLNEARQQAVSDAGAVPIGEQFGLALHVVAARVPVRAMTLGATR